VNKQISQIAVVSLLLLAGLVVATTYWQSWAAPGLAAKQDNAIQRVAQFRIRRGLIYAADGKTVLAANRAVKRGGETLYFRRYPTHGLASQVVGYSTQGRSRAGIERDQNAYLTASNANVGTIISKLTDNLKGATVTGNNLVLNIRPGAQFLAEKALRGKCGAAVVLNPKTGEVYVMASSPGYDPNKNE
jgi:peptidoglycan glycosyltransferase